MKTLVKCLIIAYVLTLSPLAKADEGMWLPNLIERLNYVDMQKMGLQLTAEEIYSVNNSSVKDAIVMLNNGFCTASMISETGLLLTNHHCALENIQKHSTVDKNLIEKGFYAQTQVDELRNEHLSASFLIRIEDVTKEITSQLNDKMSVLDRENKIDIISSKLITDATNGSHHTAKVMSFFNGNEFYLFVYETYKDVRLVLAPPMSIGKFGGDTDNWNWPRHTVDFAICRVYMSPNGTPATYNRKNIPYKPKHFLPISNQDISQNDFTMTLGYPMTTERLKTSHNVDLILEQTNPIRIKVRTKKLEILKKHMNADEKVEIAYTSKYVQSSNYWKYSIGQTEILEKLDVYENKKQLEDKFAAWVQKDAKRIEKYGDVLPQIDAKYQELMNYNPSIIHINEAIFHGADISLFAYKFQDLYLELELAGDATELSRLPRSLSYNTKKFFKNYDLATDKEVCAELFKMYLKDIPKEKHPDIMKVLEKRYKNDIDIFVDDVAKKSMFTQKDRLLDFLRDPNYNALDNDIVFTTMRSFIIKYRELKKEYRRIETEIAGLNRVFLAGLNEMLPNRKIYPDANKTMRMSYGKVTDYNPNASINDKYYTTLTEMIGKEDNDNPEFHIPKKWKDLYKKKDFGSYAQDGDIRVCFISNNDITGGSSGSPVLNTKGEITGVVFDINWEATSTPIAFEPSYTRTISTDIRSVLFTIDKFFEAEGLMNELTIKN